jgi:hypothetical protein
VGVEKSFSLPFFLPKHIFPKPSKTIILPLKTEKYLKAAWPLVLVGQPGKRFIVPYHLLI